MINATGNRMMREIQRQSRLANEIVTTQTQISSGRRIQRPSDDPVAAARIATLRQSQSNMQAWSGNLTLGSALTGQADGVMQSVSDLLIRGQELVVAGATPSANAADRGSIALELSAIADEIDALAASQSALGQPLFAQGAPLAIRFDEDVVFAPVPSRADAFDVGGISVSQHMRDAATAIASGNQPQINAALTNTAASVEHVANSAAEIGINAARLDRLLEMHASRSIDLSAERSTLEDTDLSSAIALLNSQTITLEAAQAAFARINRRTLMDILG
jgi:flagellar hook-associated protein 3 FlgL